MSDSDDLLASAGIALLELDAELHLLRFMPVPVPGSVLKLRSEDVGRPLEQLISSTVGRDLVQCCREVLSSGQVEETEIRGGDGRYFLRRVSPLNGEGLLVSFVDITRHMHADEEVRWLNSALARRAARHSVELNGTRSRIAAILRADSDAIVTFDRRGRIDTFNDAAERMFGYPASDILRQQVDRLMAPSASRDDSLIARCLGDAVPDIFDKAQEVVARRRDGTLFPAEVSISQVGDLGLFTAVIRDVSERRALQEEILHIAAEEQRKFGQELHDDIQQELTGISLLADSLTRSLAGKDMIEREQAARLAAEIARVHRSVRDLARGLFPAELDAEGLVRALQQLASETGANCGVACGFSCPETLPNLSGVKASHLYRIAQEAVTNAVKHAQARCVDISLRCGAGELGLRVADDGRGLAADALANPGLGLRIMRYRCNLIGGRLEVGNQPGGGALVSCTLPG